MTSQEALRSAMKESASVLKEAEVPFALAGSYAIWVHGGPEPSHDVDLMITGSDAERAAELLGERGFELERPAEDWLIKAHRDGETVDLIHMFDNVPLDASILTSATICNVLGVRIPVLPAHDVVSMRLRVLNEHYCDLGALLALVRPVREQLDWTRLREVAEANPYASAFLFLCDRLGVSDCRGTD